MLGSVRLNRLSTPNINQRLSSTLLGIACLMVYSYRHLLNPMDFLDDDISILSTSLVLFLPIWYRGDGEKEKKNANCSSRFHRQSRAAFVPFCAFRRLVPGVHLPIPEDLGDDKPRDGGN